MKRKNLGFVGGSILTAIVSGCGTANQPPEVTVSEIDGSPIRPWLNDVTNQYDWDQTIILPLDQEDVREGNEKFRVISTDYDGPQSLNANFYPVDKALEVVVTRGSQTMKRIEWDVKLKTDHLPRGTYPLLEGRVSDGKHTRMVGIVGIVGSDGPYEPDSNSNGPVPTPTPLPEGNPLEGSFWKFYNPNGESVDVLKTGQYFAEHTMSRENYDLFDAPEVSGKELGYTGDGNCYTAHFGPGIVTMSGDNVITSMEIYMDRPTDCNPNQRDEYLQVSAEIDGFYKNATVDAHSE